MRSRSWKAGWRPGRRPAASWWRRPGRDSSMNCRSLNRRAAPPDPPALGSWFLLLCFDPVEVRLGADEKRLSGDRGGLLRVGSAVELVPADLLVLPARLNDRRASVFGEEVDHTVGVERRRGERRARHPLLPHLRARLGVDAG